MSLRNLFYRKIELTRKLLLDCFFFMGERYMYPIPSSDDVDINQDICKKISGIHVQY